MTTVTDNGQDRGLASLLSSTTPVSVVYTDASGDQENPPRFAALRARGIVDRLEDLGAPHDDLAAVESALSETTGAPSPVSRFLVVRGGEVVIDELLSGTQVVPESVGYGPVADITPVLRHRPVDLLFVVAEVQRGGGRVSVRRTAQVTALAESTVEGRDDTLHKISGGGWSHLRYQRHTEEIWRQNEAEVAAAVDELVAAHSPAFVVAVGDPRAVRLLAGELTEPAASLVTVVEANIAPEGSSTVELD